MPQKYLKNIFLLCLTALLCLVTKAGVQGQNQNPFDIHSRSATDSTRFYADSSSAPTKTPAIPPETKEEHSSGTSENPTAPPATGSAIPETSPAENPLPPETIFEKDISTGNADTPAASAENDKNSVSVKQNPDTSPALWYYLFDLLLLLLLAMVFIYDKKIFQQIRKAFTHENFLRFLYRDTYLRKPGIFLYLNILFVLGMGFLTFRVGNYLGMASGFRHYLVVQGVVLLLFIIKHGTLQFLAGFVDNRFEVRFYQYWMILAAGFIGIWMIPLVMMVSVLPDQYLLYALIFSALIIGLALSYRAVKAMIHARFYLYKHSFHFFLYFCAVEIIPVVVFSDILTHY